MMAQGRGAARGPWHACLGRQRLRRRPLRKKRPEASPAQLAVAASPTQLAVAGVAQGRHGSRYGAAVAGHGSAQRAERDRTVRRIFIMAYRKNHIKFVGGDVLSHIMCHLWKAV